MSGAVLSIELGRIWTDYNQGNDVRNALVLCVALAERLERELDVYRQGAVTNEARGMMEAQAGQVLKGLDVESEGTVIHADFGGKERNDE